jgi:cobalamin transport system ATP-binding protein
MIASTVSSSAASPILEFRGVGFAHGARSIFEDLSFTVQPGETVALMGSNGVGKTTLLKLASALLRPSSGEVRVQGRPLRQWPRRELSCAVALVPQELEVPFAFCVEEIVAQGRVPHLGFFGALGGRDLEAVERALEEVDLLPLRRRIFASLSGGEQQRVKIAIALAQQPSLMLLDEPTQGVDVGARAQVFSVIAKAAEEGATVLCASSDYEQLSAICDRVLVFSRGQVIEEIAGDRISKSAIAEACYRSA